MVYRRTEDIPDEKIGDADGPIVIVYKAAPGVESEESVDDADDARVIELDNDTASVRL